jgi:hypothetical protein
VALIHSEIVARLRRTVVANVLLGHRLKDQPEPRWDGVANVEHAAWALHTWATEALRDSAGSGVVLAVGDSSPLQRRLEEMLRRDGHRVATTTVEDLASKSFPSRENVVIVICTYLDARRIAEVATTVSKDSQLSEIRFEYAGGLYAEREAFSLLDEYSDTWFISPVLLDRPSPYEIYEASLERFEQKCGLRDFLDLYQLLVQIVRDDVPGDIAEFGSYRGHSGYLIARSLQALGSDKRLFMFDTFESFPDESIGVDRFWSRTHDVDYTSVREKFLEFDNVLLVKGDFTETLDGSDLREVALAYVDCDSYRATRYLIDALLPTRISVGGLLVFEDYGHPALLGNRIAVHEGLRKYPGCFQFFSQFSGLYFAMKSR